jgi:hypothetical protein
MIERTIEQAEDGSYYALDAVTIEYRNTCTEEVTHFYINPNLLYSQVHDKLVELSGSKIVEGPDATQNALKKRLTALIRACIKGGLIFWGNDLLSLLYGTKDHEKPGKKDDIVDWYMDQFTKISIAYAMKSDIVLEGCKTKEDASQIVVEVRRVSTRPVTLAETKPETATSTLPTN